MISESLLVFYLRRILKERREVGSLEELKRCVREEFGEGISRERLKKLLIKKKIGRFKIITKKSEPQILEVCPVCKEKLKMEKVRTLSGKIVVEAFYCDNCNYRGFPNAWKVARYKIIL